jgi:hypothetical protein
VKLCIYYRTFFFWREYDFIFLFDGPLRYYNIGSAHSELTTIVTLAALAQIMSFLEMSNKLILNSFLKEIIFRERK